MEDKFKHLKRPVYSMLDLIEQALVKNKVMERYKARPAYQQNDYIDWITRAKKLTTKAKCLNQIITELKDGKLYMKMKYRGVL